MTGQHPSAPRRGGEALPSPQLEVLRDAMHYWEPRRLVYNILLTLVALAWLVSTWPHFRPALTLHSLYLLFVLAVLANLCYSAAYLVDIPSQDSSHRLLRRRRRWALWFAGTLLAIALENYWIADEIYAFVR